jgi:TetR/AcrR family transcriptional regulator, fatty acid metabolism regulator protein
MSPTRESTEFRRRQIVDAARRIIATRGTDALTIREIANRVGISDGNVYRHFENKRDIILLLIEDVERTLLEAVERAVHEKNKPLDSLSNVLKAHLSYVEQRRGISLIIISETVRSADSDLRQRMFKVVDQYIRRIEDLLAHGVELGQVRKDLDIDIAAFTFFALVHGTVTLWALSDSAFSLSKRHKSLWEFYLSNVIRPIQK